MIIVWLRAGATAEDGNGIESKCGGCLAARPPWVPRVVRKWSCGVAAGRGQSQGERKEAARRRENKKQTRGGLVRE
jgi:hypothetical protein